MPIPAAYLGVILIWPTTPPGIQWSAQEASFSFDAGRIALIGTGLLLYEWQALRLLNLKTAVDRSSPQWKPREY